ncbi:MAG: hypothetical protein R3A44_44570 [Caldilineaceae bacterium]
MAIVGGITVDLVGHRRPSVLAHCWQPAAVFGIGRACSNSSVIICCALLGIGGPVALCQRQPALPALFADPAAGSSLGSTIFGLESALPCR